jgi:hypothetical protein
MKYEQPSCPKGKTIYITPLVSDFIEQHRQPEDKSVNAIVERLLSIYKDNTYMLKCEWCKAHLTGHPQSGEATYVEVIPDVSVALCGKCRKETQQIDEILSQEDAGEHLTNLVSSLPGFPSLVWENGR